MIPNPKKSAQVDFPIERVKLSVQNIAFINNTYKFTSSNEIFNQYTFEALEFLSLGVFIDINLNSLGENKTEITIEIRRKIGSFNQSYEVTKANQHLVKIFDCIAKLTMKSSEEIEKLKNAKNAPKVVSTKQVSSATGEQNVPSNAWYEKSWLAILLCVLFFPVGIYALWKNSTIKKGWKIAITIISSLIVIGNIGNKGKSNSVSTSSSNNSTETPTARVEFTQAQNNSIKKTEIAEIKKNTIAALDLIAAYEANEVAADNNFKGKTFYVSGIITDIKKDIMDDIYVTLKGDDTFREVQCFFEDKETAGQMHKGMKVTFKGKCDGLMMNVLMKDCILAQ